MRSKRFEVPVELIKDFSKDLAENNIENEIVGVNDEDEIMIEVTYEKDESDYVYQLMEEVDKYKEENAEEEDED